MTNMTRGKLMMHYSISKLHIVHSTITTFPQLGNHCSTVGWSWLQCCEKPSPMTRMMYVRKKWVDVTVLRATTLGQHLKQMWEVAWQFTVSHSFNVLLLLRPQLPDLSPCCLLLLGYLPNFSVFTFNTSGFFLAQFFSPRMLYLDVVVQDPHQPKKLSSNINTMHSNFSRCTHNIQENYFLMVRIAVLQAQLQMQSLGKGNLSVE